MTIQPDQYKLQDVCTILQYSDETIRRLAAAGILVKRGRGRNARISAASVRALLDHLDRGGDLWEAPTMRSDRPAVVPMVMAASTKTKKGSGSRRSGSRPDNDPTLFVLNRNKTLK